MIPIDRVYTTVQRILNIEQRGQLPADDFNRIASLAQLDIFNKLFYDEPYYMNHPKGSEALLDNIHEMQEVFQERQTVGVAAGRANLDLTPALYRLENVYLDTSDATTGIGSFGNLVEVEKVLSQDASYVFNSNLTRPTIQFPKYVRYGGSTVNAVGSIEVYPRTITRVVIDYIRQPARPLWDGFLVNSGPNANGNGVPLFNASTSVNFELHPAMENDLIHKILIYAGLSIKQEEVTSIISGIVGQEEQIEKS